MRRLLIAAGVGLLSIFLLAPVSYAKNLIVKSIGGGPTVYRTITDALAAANDGDQIYVYYGQYAGAVVTKNVKIIGVPTGNAKPLIRLPGATVEDVLVGFKFEYVKGASVQNFSFVNLGLPIYAVGCQNLTVRQNTMNYPIQGITLWDCWGCPVSYNIVNGLRANPGRGGIGILIAQSTGAATVSSANVVASNQVINAVRGGSSEFWTAGVCLYAHTDGIENKNNDIRGNLVNLKPTVSLMVAGIMLDQCNALPTCIVKDNKVRGNSIHGVVPAYSLVQNPAGLCATCNNKVTVNHLAAPGSTEASAAPTATLANPL